MKTPLTCSAALIGTLLLWTPPAEAAAMRCGMHLIQGGGRHGPTQYEVLKKCGEPRERRAYTWFYRIGGQSFELRFSSSGILNTVTLRG